MKKISLILGALTLLCVLCVAQPSQAPVQLPDYPVTKGVSAPFAGFVNDWLVVGGGCNFPGTPAAEGGEKVYYSSCYALNIRSASPRWTEITELPCPVAYGCSVETPQGLVCIGGMNADSCLTAVFRIQRDASSGDFRIQPLPSLPETVDNAAATVLDGCVYLTGGNQKQRTNALYKLDLRTCGKWQKLASFPGPQRVQPILVNDGSKLYLMGGFQAPSGTSGSVLSHDILLYDPLTDKWQQEMLLPAESDGQKRCLAGGSGVRTDTRFIVTGGVNYTLFKKALDGKAGPDYLTHAPSWYRFNDDLLTFDFIRKEWHISPDVPGMARAGGILLYRENCLYMVCGETKPGIRTSRITVYPLPIKK